MRMLQHVIDAPQGLEEAADGASSRLWWVYEDEGHVADPWSALIEGGLAHVGPIVGPNEQRRRNTCRFSSQRVDFKKSRVRRCVEVQQRAAALAKPTS